MALVHMQVAAFNSQDIINGVSAVNGEAFLTGHANQNVSVELKNTKLNIRIVLQTTFIFGLILVQ